MRCRSLAVALAVLVLLGSGEASHAQLAPIPQDRGGPGLGLALRRLGVAARVLYVTAHPDDENNGVLVALSRGRGLHVGLLTLTRGDGGQNEIGPELFEALGVLRSEELAAVHRYDAVQQFFGRAYEFGYSFSVEETLQKWGHEATLGDVVRVVRSFRPDVVLTLPLEAPGGGQHHQAAARLAKEAFRAAADAQRFPEQLTGGLRPWQARKIYQVAVGVDSGPAAPSSTRLDTSAFDALLGLTWAELGSLARASHRCQGASQLKSAPGEGSAAFRLVDSEPTVTGGDSDLMDGVEVRLSGLARFAPDAGSFLRDGLATIEQAASEATAAYDARRPDETLAALRAGLRGAHALLDQVRTSSLAPAARQEIAQRLEEERADFEQALALAHGLVIEPVTDDGDAVRGQTVSVTTRVWNGGAQPVAVAALDLRVPAGWTASVVEGSARTLKPGEATVFRHQVQVGSEARYSQPFWKREGGADRYDVEVPADETLPWSPPDVMASLRYWSGDVAAWLERPAYWRYEGPWVGGEKQKVLNVVPLLSLRLTPSIAVFPAGPESSRREFRVSVLSNAKGASETSVRLEAPDGWQVEPPQATLAFRYEGEQSTARFFVTAPSPTPSGEWPLRAVATLPGAGEFREGYQVIAYDHIQERHLFRPAQARVLGLDVAVDPEARVGYVEGAGDDVAEALTQLGVPVTALGSDELAWGDLSRYTTIVTGIRAYQTREDLKASQGRLMNWVEAGGHLVVQYNKFEFNQLSERPQAGGFSGRAHEGPSPYAPYPAGVSSERVSVEEAPVKLLAPEHRLLSSPNRITSRDFDGWVQERGLYFLAARDPRYTELLAASDPWPNNPGEKKGLLVTAQVGHGSWTYVGLGLFRQLPAGTRGAYRLLANLVSQPH